MSKLKTRTNQPIEGNEIFGNLSVDGTITGNEINQVLDTKNYFKSSSWIKEETTYTVNEKQFTYQDLIFKISGSSNVLHVLWIGQLKSIKAGVIITRQDMKDALKNNIRYITLPPEIVAKISKVGTNVNLANGVYNIIRGSYDEDKGRFVPYTCLLTQNMLEIYSDFASYGSATDELISGVNTYKFRIEFCIILSDNLIA